MHPKPAAKDATATAGRCTDGKLENVPGTDRVMRRAPYVIHDLPQEELDRYTTREDLYRWVFGYTPLQNVFGDSITELSRSIL